MKKILLLLVIVCSVLVSTAQTFRKEVGESSESFVKRIFHVDELVHPLIETNEWDSINKTLICFVEMQDDVENGILGYILTPTNKNQYTQTLIDTFFLDGASRDLKIQTVFFANADKDKTRELVVMTTSNAHSPKYADNDLRGVFYDSFIYDNYNLQNPPHALNKFKKLSETFEEFDGSIYNAQTGKFLRKESAKYKDVKSIRQKLKQLGY